MPAAAEIERRVVHDGKLILEDVPEIPRDVLVSLMRYQNIRAAKFRTWTPDSDGLYVLTGFGDVDSIHRIEQPGGARRQLTFYDEPIGAVIGQPGGNELLFTRDDGGSEFSQIFRFDPQTGDAVMITDGESRNTAVIWDRHGSKIAFQSTRRDGAAKDIWVMDPAEPDSATLAHAATDGSWWEPFEFSASGSRVLLMKYVSVTDSSVYLLDMDSGEASLLTGGDGSANRPVAFDDESGGIWLVTDQGSEFNELAYLSADAGAKPQSVTADIPWSVSSATISGDRSRIAFVINDDGRSRLYLMDTKTRDYARVDRVPTGVVFGLQFSPDGRRLGMTLNTPQSPSDTFVLDLGEEPLDFGALTRWTTSEAGGLDTSTFRTPELVRFPTFDDDGGEKRQIPAWAYKPSGPGPHPVIIAIHGGPEIQARPVFNATYQMWLNKLGVAVIRPNVRGSAGYGKTYLGLDNGFRREDSVRDIGALLDWIATQPELDETRVGVYGASYGGYMVLASAVHYSDQLRAAVDNVGISSFVTFLENTQDYRRDLRRAEYGDERDPEMRAFLEKISPLNNVEKISIPMFVVQGQNDPRVPVTESEQIVRALREQGNTVWYMNALNEGHGYKRRKNRDKYQQAMMLFFREYLVNGD